MKLFTRLVFTAFSIVMVACSNQPYEIFVSPAGSDNNAGTADSPVSSFDKAREIVRQHAGRKKVQVTFSDGLYYLPATVVFDGGDSGTEKYPVVYRAQNRGGAVISGGSLLRLNWEPFRDGIYKATIAEDIDADQLYINGIRQRMARFPNAEPGKNVFDAWALIHTNEPDIEKDPLDKSRIKKWNNPKGGYIHAMHAYLWGDMHWKINGKVSPDSLDYTGGWQNNRPSAMHPRYRMVENIFEELDEPGEWYYNNHEKTLYFYPAGDTDLKTASVEVVRLKHLIEFQGNRELPVRFVNLEGFTFRHAARTFMENNEPLLRSDWTTYRGGAVFYNGAEDCTLTDCEFDQLGGNSIFVNNYNRRVIIKGSYIHQSGANGIAFVGDPASVRSPLFRYGDQDFSQIDRTPGPQGENFPQDCVVEDCIITLTGRDEKQTAPVQISMSNRIRISHCSIYDVPRAGINISEGTFGGHIIEYCDVFNTVLETGDHGSFNSWGRDRFWTPDIRETVAEVAKDPALPYLDVLEPNIIRNSRWRCDHGWDIDLDDGSTWYRIYNNVLLNGGLKMREGYDRHATNNVILNNTLHPHVWYANSGDIFKHNIVYGPYLPAVMQRAIAPDGKWGKEIDYNLFATSEEDRTRFSVNGADANSVVGDPMFMDAVNGDYRVSDNSPALRIGFTNFPMDEFGVVSDWLKRIVKRPVLPDLISYQTTASGEIFQWHGASVKNIETIEEQSAVGLSGKGGVLLLSVPESTMFANLEAGDVILEYRGIKLEGIASLRKLEQENWQRSAVEMVILRNQKQQKVMVTY
jgi:hypothetical protein